MNPDRVLWLIFAGLWVALLADALARELFRRHRSRRPPLARIDLHHAFAWDCPLCRRLNIAASLECGEDEAREVLELEPWQEMPEGSLFAAPRCVECAACGRRFRTAMAKEM